MSPSPFLSPQSKQDSASCDVSLSSNSCIDDFEIQDFDDAVDFEPLIVTGSGKILSYHQSSFYDEESTASVIGNAWGHYAPRVRSLSSSRSARSLALLGFAALIMVGTLSLFATDNDSQRPQTTVLKKVAGTFNRKKDIIQQHMMDAEDAALEASNVQAVFWEPYSDTPEASRNNNFGATYLSMTLMMKCVGRPISKHHDYQLQRMEAIPQPQPIQPNANDIPLSAILAQQQSSVAGPMLVFTSNFRQAVMELFDSHRKGAFIAFIHDPIVVYMEHYAAQSGPDNTVQNRDNLLVRQLADITKDREVNDDDLKVAKHVLRSKFVIGSCDNPAITLQRLMRMMGRADSSTLGGESCTRERQRWNQECRKTNEMSQQLRDDPANAQILERIELEHRYDVLLYDESKNLFREQKALFE
ncbi:hypothetical protein ACHAXT_006766 [Thalassiosira profunda]